MDDAGEQSSISGKESRVLGVDLLRRKPYQ